MSERQIAGRLTVASEAIFFIRCEPKEIRMPKIQSSEYNICEGRGHAAVLLGVFQRTPFHFRVLEWKRFLIDTSNCTPAHGIEVFGITFQDGDRFNSCQVIYSQFGFAIHQNDHQARRRFVEWTQNEIAVVPDFHKRILFSDEANFWLNGYVNKQNCRIWSEANPQVYVETPLHPEKLTVWCFYGLVESLVRTSSKSMKATTLQSMVIGIEP
ncbi:hypothetical protein TNCV_5094331 [Trichonephila clavipes]|nr:hypothetical protein TNCV_5094331 [Trichonephila clavipes]